MRQEGTLYGKPVIVNDSKLPRIQVSREFARIQDPKLVKETNDWMTEFFGFQWLVPDGEVLVFNGSSYVMNPNTYKALREKLKSEVTIYEKA